LHHKKQKKGRYTPGKGGYNTGIITVSCHEKFSFLVCKKFLGSGEQKKRVIRFYFSLAERISPDSKMKPKKQEERAFRKQNRMNDVPLVIHPVVLLSNCKKLNALQFILFYPAYNG